MVTYRGSTLTSHRPKRIKQQTKTNKQTKQLEGHLSGITVHAPPSLLQHEHPPLEQETRQETQTLEAVVSDSFRDAEGRSVWNVLFYLMQIAAQRLFLQLFNGLSRLLWNSDMQCGGVSLPLSLKNILQVKWDAEPRRTHSSCSHCFLISWGTFSDSHSLY